MKESTDEQRSEWSWQFTETLLYGRWKHLYHAWSEADEIEARKSNRFYSMIDSVVDKIEAEIEARRENAVRRCMTCLGAGLARCTPGPYSKCTRTPAGEDKLP